MLQTHIRINAIRVQDGVCFKHLPTCLADVTTGVLNRSLDDTFDFSLANALHQLLRITGVQASQSGLCRRQAHDNGLVLDGIEEICEDPGQSGGSDDLDNTSLPPSGEDLVRPHTL